MFQGKPIPMTPRKGVRFIIRSWREPGPTVDELRAYREEHGCSLREAIAALGWGGNRMEVVGVVGDPVRIRRLGFEPTEEP